MTATPRWTQRLYPQGSGQDHLGLASVSSDQILPALSPGIVVQTVHPRYWSFYCFLLDEFWRQDLPRTRADYSVFYRPRESVFAVATQLCNRTEHRKHGPYPAVVGSLKARRVAREGLDAFDPSYDYIKGALGGYGLYYANQLELTGATGKDSTTGFDAPTRIGAQLAEAFRASIADTRYYREYFHSPQEPVPGEVMLEYIRKACLCQLQRQQAPDLPGLQNVFLRGGVTSVAERRRSTLRYFLDLGSQTHGHKLTEDRFRQLAYYWGDKEGADYSPRPDLMATAQRWRLFQLREYFSYAITRLWSLLCTWGHAVRPEGTPAPLSAWHSELLERLGSQQLAALGIGGQLTPDSALSQLASAVRREMPGSSSLAGPWAVDSPLSEHSLYQRAHSATGAEGVAECLLLLNQLMERLSVMAKDADPLIIEAGGTRRLSLRWFHNEWSQRLQGGATIEQVVSWIYLDCVIAQHERTAMGKLATTGDTFRFQRERDLIRFFDKDASARMNNPRFQSIATTVYELGLIGSLYSENHALTSSGKAVLDGLDPR